MVNIKNVRQAMKCIKGNTHWQYQFQAPYIGMEPCRIDDGSGLVGKKIVVFKKTKQPQINAHADGQPHLFQVLCPGFVDPATREIVEISRKDKQEQETVIPTTIKKIAA
jgi:hypothetical protein